MCLEMQTITAAESRAGVHHFDCWKKKPEEMKTHKTTRADKEKKTFPQAPPSRKQESN